MSTSRTNRWRAPDGFRRATPIGPASGRRLTTYRRNLLGSKEFFFFGSDAVEAKALEAYKKAQKSAEGALDNISWAAHTGKGLLFSGNKETPSNVINLVGCLQTTYKRSDGIVLTRRTVPRFRARG